MRIERLFFITLYPLDLISHDDSAAEAEDNKAHTRHRQRVI
jgi:hypothetical protein